jgi:hypothetical protein
MATLEERDGRPAAVHRSTTFRPRDLICSETTQQRDMRSPSKPATLLFLALFALGCVHARGAERALISNSEAESPGARGPRAPVLDASRYMQVEIADPYLELRTGPGRGYPIVHVVPRGERVDILFRRTDWHKVRDERGREGWADSSQMAQTLLPGRDAPPIRDRKRRSHAEERWEAGAQSGNFESANVNSVSVAYSLTELLALEAGLSQVFARSAESVFGTLGFTYAFRPEWRLSPFLQLGTGAVRTSPRFAISEDHTDQLAYLGAGLKYSLSRRFFFRADYRSYLIFKERESNEESQEWKIGFAFSF